MINYKCCCRTRNDEQRASHVYFYSLTQEGAREAALEIRNKITPTFETLVTRLGFRIDVIRNYY